MGSATRTASFPIRSPEPRDLEYMRNPECSKGAAPNREHRRDEDQKLRLTTDPHSPAQFRVNGPLANMPEFQKAFNVPDGSAMVRPTDKRVNIW